MRHTTGTGIAALLLAGAALAQEAAPQDVYETYSGGQLVGTETASRPAPGGALRGRTEITIAGAKVTFEQEGTLDATGRRLVAYRCDVQTPGGPARVRAILGEAGWTVDAGTPPAPEPQATQSFPAGASTIVLDNNLASHLDLLCRDLAVAGAETASYTALVPQVLASVPLHAKRGEAGRGTLDGAPVEAVRYRLDMANVLIEVSCRKGDGALLDASVPIQSARYVRKGFASAPEEAPAPSDRREKSAVVKGPAGDLAAVLTVPAAEKPVPGVLMLSGSGPNDRDETVGPNKPFRDLARGLADRGVATLRFDKRTVTVKDASKASTIRDEYVVDALEALKQLRAADGVDPSRTFILGHSLGTLAAPLVAREAGGVSGLILLAGPARPIDDLLRDQIAAQMRLAGQDAAAIEAQTASLAKEFARLRGDPADATSILGAPAAYWRDVLKLDLASLVAESKLPALILQGEQDVQVSKVRDFEALRAKLGDGGGRFAYRSFPALNHLLIPVEGEGTGREYGIAGHVDPAVPEAIAVWIRAR